MFFIYISLDSQLVHRTSPSSWSTSDHESARQVVYLRILFETSVIENAVEKKGRPVQSSTFKKIFIVRITTLINRIRSTNVDLKSSISSNPLEIQFIIAMLFYNWAIFQKVGIFTNDNEWFFFNNINNGNYSSSNWEWVSVCLWQIWIWL